MGKAINVEIEPSELETRPDHPPLMVHASYTDQNLLNLESIYRKGVANFLKICFDFRATCVGKKLVEDGPNWHCFEAFLLIPALHHTTCACPHTQGMPQHTVHTQGRQAGAPCACYKTGSVQTAFFTLFWKIL